MDLMLSGMAASCCLAGFLLALAWTFSSKWRITSFVLSTLSMGQQVSYELTTKGPGDSA